MNNIRLYYATVYLEKYEELTSPTASQSSILSMSAVSSVHVVGTVKQSIFISTTGRVINKDGTCSGTKPTTRISSSIYGIIISEFHRQKYSFSILYLEYPSCPHTTLASMASQASSQTVPHVSLMQTSIRPSKRSVPPTSRTCPVLHIAVSF